VQAELHRIFGAGAVREAQREAAQERRNAHGGRGGGRRGGGSRGGVATRARRTTLVQHREHWPPYVQSGLEMQLSHGDGEVQYFAFVHNDEYRRAQGEYELAAATYDPNAIVGVLQFYPYHIDSLVQLAEAHVMVRTLPYLPRPHRTLGVAWQGRPRTRARAPGISNGGRIWLVLRTCIACLQGGELERAGDMYERAIYAMECERSAPVQPKRPLAPFPVQRWVSPYYSM
jgi:hypothetical protein